MRILFKGLKWLCALTVAFVAVACSDYRSDWRDDNPNFWPTNFGDGSLSEESSVDSVANEDSLMNCTKKREGMMYYVVSESAIFECVDGEWGKSSRGIVPSVATEDDLKVCSPNREGSKVYVREARKNYVCHNELWDPAPDVPGEKNSSSDSQKGNSSSSRSSGEPGKNCEPSEILDVTTAYLNDNVDYETFVDTRDCKRYRTVEIGSSVWLAQNLDYDTEDDESMCVDDDEAKCDKYGRLYTWQTAVDVCPDGWVLASKTDFDELLEVALGEKTKAASLVSANASVWEGVGEDVLGFSALPAGYDASNTDIEVGYGANFWTSSAAEENAYYLHILQDGGLDASIMADFPQFFALSVRCVKEE